MSSTTSGVYARLAEDWLDSAGERTYQGPFCQMLAALGYEVVHSTRHSQIELGKDVIATRPGRRPVAFQLKGNPGGRLTLTQFREIKPQLDQLVTLPISETLVPQAQIHAAYLVTNGQVDEEVHLAIREMNAGYRQEGRPRRLRLIHRGRLLKLAQSLGWSLWPSELRDTRLLLNILALDGSDHLPVAEFHFLLGRTLGLLSEKTQVSAPEARRTIASAALIAGIGLQNYYRAENHYAVFLGWTMFAAYAVGYGERHGVRAYAPFVVAARREMHLALAALCAELRERQPGEYTQGLLLADWALYSSRRLLLCGLMALYWFWSEREGWTSIEDRDFIHRFMRVGGETRLDVWGQAAVPQAVLRVWWLHAAMAGRQGDAELRALYVLCSKNERDQPNLPNPYYGWEDVVRLRMALPLPANKTGLREESRRDGYFFSETLMHLMVRANMKSDCKLLWPEHTKLDHQWFQTPSRWEYCLVNNSGSGALQSKHLPPEKAWEDLRLEARSIACPHAPKALLDDPLLLASYILLAPARATPHVLRRLGHDLDPQWFIGPPLK